MALCPVCGNENETERVTCMFCGNELDREPHVPPHTALLHKTINLEHGRPLVETALRRLNSELLLARTEKITTLTLIHGYGSSGKGGRIRIECRKVLDHLVRRGELHSYIPGEHFHKRSGAGKSLLRRFPQLEKIRTADLDNPGITLVVL